MECPGSPSDDRSSKIIAIPWELPCKAGSSIPVRAEGGHLVRLIKRTSNNISNGRDSVPVLRAHMEPLAVFMFLFHVVVRYAQAADVL